MNARTLPLVVSPDRLGGLAAILRAYRHHLAIRRCRRLLARSDAAREAGRAKAAAYLVARAAAALPPNH